MENSRVIRLAANDCVRADEHASAALDTNLRVPHRDLAREISFFELRCACRIRAVVRQDAYRHAIAATRHDLAQHIAHEFRRTLDLPIAS